MTRKGRRDRIPSRIRQPNLLRVFLFCFFAVGVFFLLYEIVERTWLKGVKPEAIYTLHILRGFTAAAIASVLATLVLLRQTRETGPESILPPSAKSWKRRLQKLHLRTKIAVPMVFLAILPAITVGIFTISQMQKSLRESAVQELEFDSTSKARAIQGFLQTVQQDLHFLSRTKKLRELVAADAAGSGERSEDLRRRAEHEFLIFSQGKRAYYQVRYLNNAGHEVVRLNVEEGRPKIVPPSKLQDKSNRYYVKAAFALDEGEIYISPMDLNIEYGKIEIPPRGVIRYATPVTGEGETGRGLLVINIFSDYLLSLIGPLATGTEAWLINQYGSYLGYVGEAKERRSLYSLEKGRQLSEDYTPEEYQSILEHSATVLSVKRGEFFLSNAPISIDQRDPGQLWTLMIGHPQASVIDPIRHLTMFLSVVVAFVVAMAAFIGVLIGEYLSRPIVRLQNATRDIAAGNLERRVEVTTGDEIERLANDFNAMTEKLYEAQKKLSVWNLELEREVERQTGILQRLQSGMARSDKLASIGQITAGVMHEVGNPLAAIKTKIQVADEDGALSAESREVLTEIVDEVDRLSSFLRSFSRLSRLGGREIMKEVSMAEVVQSVIGLVFADLRRRGVGLRFEASKDLPKVRGVADQLRQVIMNLILNAADASRRGGEVVVRVKQAAPLSENADLPDRVGLEVVDQGDGIPKEILDRIWDPFFTTKQEGTGLGLAICRQIVQDHGGTIEIKSHEGKGTAVVVTLPTRDGKA